MLVVPTIDVPVDPPAPVIIVAVPPLFSISIPPAHVAVISNQFSFATVGVVIVGLVASTGLPVPVGVLFLISFPVVPSNNAGTQSVALAGQVTSPHPLPPVLAIVTIQSAPVPVVVSVILAHSTN